MGIRVSMSHPSTRFLVFHAASPFLIFFIKFVSFRMDFAERVGSEDLVDCVNNVVVNPALVCGPTLY